MFIKVLRDFSRPHWIDIIQAIKGSSGMSVAELAKILKMSYMGVKQHCVDMEKKGYLTTWRRPKAMGRPEKAYRLTPKCDPLFPEVGLGFTVDLLKMVAKNYGATAPEKLLFQHFQNEVERYSKKVKGNSITERTESLSKLRDAEGYRSVCEYDSERGLCMVEYHSLLEPLAAAFPNLLRMEEAMVGKVLRTTVARKEEDAVAGLKRRVFQIGAL